MNRTICFGVLLSLAMVGAACDGASNASDAGDATFGANCPGQTITGDRQVDLHLRSTAFSGAVTIDGSAQPVSLQLLRFHNRDTEADGSIALGTDGAFSVRVDPGHYDVTVDVVPDSTTRLPSQGTVTVASNLDLSGDLQRNFDIATTHVQGQVTVDGHDIVPTRTSLVFIDHDMPTTQLHVSLDDTGSFTGAIPSGHYDIATDVSDPQCSFTIDPPLPCSRLADTGVSVDVSEAGTIPMALHTVQLNVVLRNDGTPVRGQRMLRLTRVHGNGTVDFYATGSMPALLYPGTYSLSMLPPAFSTCDVADGLPCGEVLLDDSIDVIATMEQLVDITSVVISGHVTVEGQPVPVGGLIFQRTDRSGDPPVRADAASGMFSSRLFPGTYDVFWDARGVYCDVVASVPCVSQRIATDVSIGQTTSMDFDMPRVQLIVAVTRAGASLADGGRGAVQIRSVDMPDSVPTVQTLPTSGSASATLRVIPGHYWLAYEGEHNLCENTVCGTAVLDADADIEESTTLTRDFQPATIHGQVYLDDQPSSASLSFRNVDSGSVRVAEGQSMFSQVIPSGRTVITAHGPTVVDQLLVCR